ncbi:MAG: methyltransferase domain-containing protein [Bdellovibrionales bacterium]|nr:methyltransferase domain-containing protein [Bdellovibrionales bacterium]
MSGSYQLSKWDSKEEELLRLQQQHLQFQKIEQQWLQDSGLEKSSRVLEIGCGPGFVSRSLLTLIPEGHLLSIDNDMEMEPLWKKNTDFGTQISDHGSCEFQCLDFSIKDIKIDETFDFCYLRFVFQHVKNLKNVLDNVKRHLKPQGKIIIVDSDDQLLFCHPHNHDLRQLLAQVQNTQRVLGGDRFVGRKLPDLLKQSDFTHVHFQSLTFTNGQYPFKELWQLSMGYKMKITRESQSNIDQLLECLSVLDKKKSLFFHVGVIVAIGTVL